MQRWKLTIEYDGSPYAGWQRQDGPMSVQQAVEEAIEAFCGQPVRLHVAGRTDTGVHALGQVAHCDIERPSSDKEVRDAITHYLQIANHRIAITEAKAVNAEFHARFHATERQYLYRLLNRRPPSMLRQNRVWHIRQPLNIEVMRQAAAYFLGEHDFTSFRATACQSKSPMRSIDEITIEEAHDNEVHITVRAKSFLHHQIRNMTGTLVKIGKGHWLPEKVPELIAAKDRRKAADTAPACGLYFVSVAYPE